MELEIQSTQTSAADSTNLGVLLANTCCMRGQDPTGMAAFFQSAKAECPSNPSKPLFQAYFTESTAFCACLVKYKIFLCLETCCLIFYFCSESMANL